MGFSTVYRQEIGVIFDAINMFMMKLNERPLWINRMVQKNTETDDVSYINYWMSQFDDIPRHLVLFFHLKDQQGHGFWNTQLWKLMQDVGSDFTHQDVIEYIKNGEKVKKDVIQFYLEKELSDVHELGEELRKKTDIDGLIRFYLMDFVSNTDGYINDLCNAFILYYEKTLELYREKALAILKWQETIQGNNLYNFIVQCYSQEVVDRNLQGFDGSIAVTMSLFIKNCILFKIDGKVKLAILGIFYQQPMKEYNELVIDIAALGNAFGDKHRLNIIKLLLKYNELTVSDIANKLGLAVNSVSYHLDIMRKANLLWCRSRGKATVYWLNTKVCAIISDILETWSKGGDNGETSVEKTIDYTINSF